MRIRTLITSLLAVFALGAVASASASAACLRVAEQGTGNKDSSTCTTNTGAEKNEFIEVAKVEKELARSGEWCAKVKVATTGNYATLATCEAGTPKVAGSEFIRVLVGWDVCQEVAGPGTEPRAKYDEHKCNTQTKPLAERKWQFTFLEGTDTFDVTSSGNTFTLTAGGKTITCKKVTDTGIIEADSKDRATEIKFTECTTGTAGCEVKNKGGVLGTVVVTEIPTLLEVVEEKLVDKFEQKLVGTTKEFVTLEFSGSSCSAAGYVTTKVKGDVAAEVKNETNGEVKLTFPTPAIPQTPKLEAFGVAATLLGVVNEKLTNGWAFRAI